MSRNDSSTASQDAMDVDEGPAPLKPEGAPLIRYGTAGFRGPARWLEHVAYRVGMVAALRAQHVGGSVGVVITASHNPQEDNGMKIIDPSGGMMAQDWEDYATQIVNAPNEELQATVDGLRNLFRISNRSDVRILVGRDTRPSGFSLSRLLRRGVETILQPASKFRDLGYLTTPQVHTIVESFNFGVKHDLKPKINHLETEYFNALCNSYAGLVLHHKNLEPVYLDCACGVASLKYMQIVKSVAETLQEMGGGRLQICGFNDSTDNPFLLNSECGADYVKVRQRLPRIHGVSEQAKELKKINLRNFKFEPSKIYASVDGDADRLVFYYLTKTQDFRLLDGDKIAALLSLFIVENLKKAGIYGKLKIAVVQTAYANGNSTKFFQSLDFPVICVPTGVKHLHHEALKYDIGIYFEANGHGTILFSNQFHEILKCPMLDSTQDTPEQHAASSLLKLHYVMNKNTGDAFSLLLAAHAALTLLGKSIEDWDSLYQDLPCLQLKVKVKDRYAIETADAERRVAKPEGLQAKIDTLVSGFAQGRAFARPSGTEDVVRVYAEAATSKDTQSLATQVAQAVFDWAGGVGDRP